MLTIEFPQQTPFHMNSTKADANFGKNSKQNSNKQILSFKITERISQGHGENLEKPTLET